MVYYYKIRGGACRNGSSHITLTSDDITCYVGEDKHENEYLIKYGWPGDVWFHVEGLSSAHVYFRVMAIAEPHSPIPVSGIPLDDLPEQSVQDMMQICKHNSISGCKLASCKMVYTPHANLKKTFTMDAGTVTYHDTKQCRYLRCDKDSKRVKELEKTKTERRHVNFYEELKEQEARIIHRKKVERQHARLVGGDDAGKELYDPLQEDARLTKLKATRVGDEQSGIDHGLEALEGLTFAAAAAVPANRKANEQNDDNEEDDQEDAENQPLWVRQARARASEKQQVRFLRERGYPQEETAKAFAVHSSNPLAALKYLWQNLPCTAPESVESVESADPTEEELATVRQEEREVLESIFGEDEGVRFYGSSIEDEGSSDGPVRFDAVLPVTAYEVPARYSRGGDEPPPLLLEVYVDDDMAPGYPYTEPPVLALIGGGLPEAALLHLTQLLRQEALERCAEEPGDPQIFTLLSLVGTQVEEWIQLETEQLQEEQRQKQAQLKAEAERLAKEQGKLAAQEKLDQANRFRNDAERRAYAKAVVAAGAASAPPAAAAKAGSNQKAKVYQNTGVSDQSLIQDMFG